MKLIKNILFVSYLKNKDIRRICFVVGMALFLWGVFTTPRFYEYTRINRDYINIRDIKIWADAYREREPLKYLNLVECTTEYFENVGIKYSENLFVLENPVEDFCRLYGQCEKFKIFALDKINLDCGKKDIFLYRPLFICLAFYLPFLLVCLFKFAGQAFVWIYKGFKEE